MAEGQFVSAGTPVTSFGDQVPIAYLSPGLPDVFSKSIKAVVTLKWPYSSSNRVVALLLAEPDFRLRRLNGQVRVQFTGSSARALARSEISSGDEVILSLRGVEWIKKSEPPIRTPGKGVDWELRFGERLILQIDNNETHAISTVDVDHPPQSPEPEEIPSNGLYGGEDLSQLSQGTPISAKLQERLKDRNKWSSPAFIKRARLSYGSLFAGDAFSEEDGSVPGKGRKRSRRSSSWRYQSRSPSPESEDSDEQLIEKTPATPARLVVAMTDEGCQTMDFDDENGFGTSNGFGSRPRSAFQSEIVSPSPASYFSNRPQGPDSPQVETPRAGQWINAQSQGQTQELGQPLQTPNIFRTDAGTSPSRPPTAPFATGATQTSLQQLEPQSSFDLPSQHFGQHAYSTFGKFATLDSCATVPSPHPQDRALAHDVEENRAMPEETPSFHQNDLPLAWQDAQDLPESAVEDDNSYPESKLDTYGHLDYDMHSNGPYFTTGDVMHGRTGQEIKPQGQMDTVHDASIESEPNLPDRYHHSLKTLGSATLSARDNQATTPQKSNFGDESISSPAIKTGDPQDQSYQDDLAEESDTGVIKEAEQPENRFQEIAQPDDEEAEFEDEESFEENNGNVASAEQGDEEEGGEEEEESGAYVPTDRLGNPLHDDFLEEHGWRRGDRDQYENPLPFDKEEDYDAEEEQSDGQDGEEEEYESEFEDGDEEGEADEEMDDAPLHLQQTSAPIVIDLLSSDDEDEPEPKPQVKSYAKGGSPRQTSAQGAGVSNFSPRGVEDTGMEDEDKSMEGGDDIAEPREGDLGEESGGNVDEDESMEEDNFIMDPEGEVMGNESDGIVDEDGSMGGEDIQDDPIVDEQIPQPILKPSRSTAKEEAQDNDEYESDAQAVDAEDVEYDEEEGEDEDENEEDEDEDGEEEEEEEEEVEAADQIRYEDGQDEERQFKSSEMVEDDEEEGGMEAQSETKAADEEQQSEYPEMIEDDEYVEDGEDRTRDQTKDAENQDQEQPFKPHEDAEDSSEKQVVDPTYREMDPQYNRHFEPIEAAPGCVEESHYLEDNPVEDTQTGCDQDSMVDKELRSLESYRPEQKFIEEETQTGYYQSSMEDDESGSVSTEAFSYLAGGGNASDDAERNSKRGRYRKRVPRRSLSEKEYKKEYKPDGMDYWQIRVSGAHEYELRRDPSEPQLVEQGDKPERVQIPSDESEPKAVSITEPNKLSRSANEDHDMEDAGPLLESTAATVNKTQMLETQPLAAAEEDAPVRTQTAGSSLAPDQAANVAPTTRPEPDKIQESALPADDGDTEMVMGEATIRMQELHGDGRPSGSHWMRSLSRGASESISPSKPHNNDLGFDGTSDSIGSKDMMQFEDDMRRHELHRIKRPPDDEHRQMAELMSDVQSDVDDFHDAQETVSNPPQHTEQPEESLDVAVDSARRGRRSKTPIPPVERAQHALEHEAPSTFNDRYPALVSDPESIEYLEPGFKPSSLTVPRLRYILGSHNIPYPPAAKKVQLVEIFNENIVPQAEVVTTNVSQDEDKTSLDKHPKAPTLRVERVVTQVVEPYRKEVVSRSQAAQESLATKRSDSKLDIHFDLNSYEPYSLSGVIEEVMEASSSLRSNAQRSKKDHKLQPSEVSKLKKGVEELEQLVSSTSTTLPIEKQAGEKDTDVDMTVKNAEEFVMAPEQPSAVPPAAPRTRLAARRAVTPLLAATGVGETELMEKSPTKVAQPDMTTPNVLQGVPRTRRALNHAARPLSGSAEKENTAQRQRSETVDSVKTSIEQEVLSTNNPAAVPRTRVVSKRAVPTIIETMDDKMETDHAEHSVVASQASQASQKLIEGDVAETSNTLTPTSAVRTRSAREHRDAECVQHENTVRSGSAKPSAEESEELTVAPTTPPRTRSGSKYGLALVTGDVQSRRSPSLVVEGHESPEGQDASAELASAAFGSPTKSVTRTRGARTSLNAALGVKLSRAISTDHGVFSRLKQLKQNLGKRLDVLAIVTSAPNEPEKAKKSPKHFYIKFNVTDASIGPANVTEIQVFRPYKNSLPIVQVGDGILLRNFVVRSEKGKGFALRSETNEGSSWAVFKGKGAVDIRGPPVEYAAGEEENMAELKTWYDSLDNIARNRLDRANAAKPSTSMKTTPTKHLTKT